jgi:hypothetical protein
MAVENDSKVGLYFMGLIFVGLAIGGIIGINQTQAYWAKFCAERQDIEECQLFQTQPQAAISSEVRRSRCSLVNVALRYFPWSMTNG